MTPGYRLRTLWQLPILCALILHSACARADKETQADILTLALPASAYLMTRNRDDTAGAWALTKSLGLSAATTLALNAIIDKDSPNGSSTDAFPSGHSTIAFSSAAYLQRRYGWRSGVPAYVIAGYVGYLRVDTDDHDVTDVIGGAAVGILSSYLMTRPYGENFQASMWTDGESAGVWFQLRW